MDVVQFIRHLEAQYRDLGSLPEVAVRREHARILRSIGYKAVYLFDLVRTGNHYGDEIRHDREKSRNIPGSVVGPLVFEATDQYPEFAPEHAYAVWQSPHFDNSVITVESTSSTSKTSPLAVEFIEPTEPLQQLPR
jgi:hypothetical protein